MTTPLTIARLPRPFDPALGEETRAALPQLSADHGQLIAGVGGTSPYLKGLILQETSWLAPALDDPDAAVAGVFEACRALAPDQLKPGLRQAKRRIALITALADICGAWPLEKVTGILSDFAGEACDLALKSEIATLVRRGKLPGQSAGDVAEAAGLCVLAMGKMGAHELNYSSDIDLICLFDETRYDADSYQEARAGLIRATRNMASLLSEKTADGYVFRTDLRLRPDPAVTPVCISMAAAETYYESLGRTWERAAYIKARPCAGDIEAGWRFLQTLRPFVWRRHLDFAAIQDAHDIRLRIRENKGTGGPITVPGHDMKLGRGGIREIEFFTQTRQLIAGGRDPDLRLRGTVEGLAALAAKGWVPEEAASRLTDHYRAHREVEHRIQMIHDAQTHRVPGTEDGIERIACLMGTSSAELTRELTRRLTEVHELTEDFFAPDAAPPPPAPEAVGLDASILARWPSYPALRSQRAQRIFERLKPELLTRLARTEKPDEALLALDGFLSGLPAGVQLFSLFEANPQLIDLLVDIAGTSHALAQYLSRNAGVFDAVIGGDFFAPWPGEAALRSEIAARLAAEPDYETQLDMARRWMKEWHFRIGVHLLRGLIPADIAGRHYAELAGAVIAAVAPLVRAQFEAKHGAPPGRGAVVLGMGSLGAQRLNAGSDLDLIVVYDPGTAESSDGPRPLAVRPYYARLTQALVTALTAPMAEGRLYEVDMRLRPSGSQGPVATSWASFTHYQRHEAWTWEHLALTRARVVVGEDSLAADIEAFRREIVTAPQDRGKVLQDVAEMRDRLAAAKTPRGLWDAKTGAGRMLDIELAAQTGALLSGTVARDVAAGLQGGVGAGWLSAAEAETLSAAYELYWAVHTAARLISATGLSDEALSEGAAGVLCRTSGMPDIAALRARMSESYATAAALIDEALTRREVA
ncbi:[protein-PII] uridylyltransferase family protein [Pseudodonghicola flavimaris]|uniref:Glutamine-synthetase adenylyltransferase n=1 Tax=Pseudodonghicola flavimaris TaxID=3050036 RepID=A0ABT7EVF4_9RHOB|nr:glutamine-synthetase adenylyltransferase [Pseudodonghicola flavimaris]MDK3016322.1 glutamine-synthetase adenylyltransferase [Pseudodonghicola flavimaris]